MGVIEETIESFKSVAKQVGACSSTMFAIKQTIYSLENTVYDLENRKRRNNLIFFGIPENSNETRQELENVISEIVQDKLGIKDVGVERIHRNGKRSTGKSRLLILKLLDFSVKESILRNARKLKGTRISISEEFSIHIRQK